MDAFSAPRNESAVAMASETMSINVRIAFGHSLVNDDSERFTIDVAADGSDTILQVKEKIAVRLEQSHVSSAPRKIDELHRTPRS